LVGDEPLGPSINPKAAERKAAVRKNVVEAVRLLASAGKANRKPDRRVVSPPP
jgi:hypothetical protein